jgi:hypothetical protein
MNRRLLLVLGLVGCAWLLLSDGASAQGGEEACFTSRANGARAAAGLPAMSTNDQLVQVARQHSQEMASSGTIFHNPQLASQVTTGWKLLGENVGVGPACDSVHEAFMDSPAHRKNILEPKFDAVGMGVVISGNTIYVTEAFMQTKAAPAPAPPAPPPPPKPSPSPRPPAAPKPAPPQPVPPPSPQPSPAPPAPSVSVQAGQTAQPSPTSTPPPGGSVPVALLVGGAIVAVAAVGGLSWYLFKQKPK